MTKSAQFVSAFVFSFSVEILSFMKIILKLSAVCISLIIFSSCVTSAYITDEQSIKRQKEMRKYRTGINFAEAGLLIASTVGAVFTGVSIYAQPQSKSYRKMLLISASKDTLFVNMVTDWRWKDSVYCDIREIVLPPMQRAKVLVPMGAAYNIFFRNDFNAPDDEKIELNTAVKRRLKLKPEKEKSQFTSGN
jgi:hypothetical protein